MKHIWWLNHHAGFPVNFTGARHYSLAVSLQKKGYKVTIINGTFSHTGGYMNKSLSDPGAILSPILKTYDGVDFYSIPTPFYIGNASIGRVKNMIAFYFGTMKYLRGRTSLPKPDLIIGSEFHPFAAYAWDRLSKYF